SESVDMFTKLDLTVNQGRVLITGVVQDPAHRVEAVRLAWKPTGVQQVINEIRVAERALLAMRGMDGLLLACGRRLRWIVMCSRSIIISMWCRGLFI
ncbi:BON domain-containing protein, partial [Alphaproteobacteria bacterium]|nr:BON domain-containing protein [Alphaproteobacteria bacterium]